MIKAILKSLVITLCIATPQNYLTAAAGNFNVNAQDQDGNTALHRLCLAQVAPNTETSVSLKLVDFKPRCTIETSIKEFILPAKETKQKIMQLLENGADIKLRNNNDKTAHDIALQAPQDKFDQETLDHLCGLGG